MTLLEAQKISFSYSKLPVLTDVSLRLTAGEIVGLIGPNGSGKSTLLRVLLGQLPAHGDVSWNGRPLDDWPHRDLARLVAYLPQSPASDPDQTVAEVLLTGRAPYWGAFGVESPRDLKVVRSVADRLSLTQLLDCRIGELSGGQRQLIFVARCLAQEPTALLLDEPNTYLDLRHQVELARLLKNLSLQQGIAVLMASHDLNLAAALADRLVILNEGTVAADGSPIQVLQTSILSSVYGTSVGRFDPPGGRAPIVYPEIMLES